MAEDLSYMLPQKKKMKTPFKACLIALLALSLSPSLWGKGGDGADTSANARFTRYKAEAEKNLPFKPSRAYYYTDSALALRPGDTSIILIRVKAECNGNLLTIQQDEKTGEFYSYSDSTIMSLHEDAIRNMAVYNAKKPVTKPGLLWEGHAKYILAGDYLHWENDTTSAKNLFIDAKALLLKSCNGKPVFRSTAYYDLNNIEDDLKKIQHPKNK